MKMYLMCFAALMSFSFAFSQNNNTGFSKDPNAKTSRNQAGAVISGNSGNNQSVSTKDEFFSVIPLEDKSILVEIIGTGDMTFAVSNTSNGISSNLSYSHSDQIVISLRTNSKDTSYQLVFYSTDENFKKIYSEEGTLRSIYFPMSMYTDIRTKLEQSFASRKKVQLRLTFKKEEYNEAKLLFN